MGWTLFCFTGYGGYGHPHVATFFQFDAATGFDRWLVYIRGGEYSRPWANSANTGMRPVTSPAKQKTCSIYFA